MSRLLAIPPNVVAWQLNPNTFTPWMSHPHLLLLKPFWPFDDKLRYENNIDSSDQEFVLSNSESYQAIDGMQSLEATKVQPLVHKCVLHDISADHLCDSWKTIFSTLIQLYLHCISRTLGRPLPPFLLATMASWTGSLIWYFRFCLCFHSIAFLKRVSLASHLSENIT